MRTWDEVLNLRIFKTLQIEKTGAIVFERDDGTMLTLDAFLLSESILSQQNPVNKTGATTLTASELLTGLIIGNPGGLVPVVYTMPTGTDLETKLQARYPGVQNNYSFDFSIINTSVTAAEDITLGTAAGITLVGNMVIGAALGTATTEQTSGRFRVRRTAQNAYTVYRIS